MPTLPIPMFVSLILVFLLVALLQREGRHGMLALLLGACAAQGFIISLAQHYGLAAARGLQPINAALIPALAWVSFQATAIRGAQWLRDSVHLLGPLFAVFCLIYAPAWLDLLIPALFIAYGSTILITLTHGGDALPRTRLATGDMALQIWRVIGVCLIGSAASDVLIVAAQIAGLQAWQPWIISVFSSGTLLLLGALTLSDSLSEPDDEPQSVPVDDSQDEDLMARLGQLMENQKLYLNPDLTLTHLARWLHVPVKRLSAAINRATGENVSRYINRQRIAAACRALEGGETVTSAMLTAGFNTKSNFNRAFLQMTGQSPSDWMRDRPPGKGA